ncbi:hypothetical protein T281_14110 [Rhodomicrobium udaipurense JA643]|nr:DUF1127 domain-containing protein [Rhodomicrobium udaipurense]KAI93883.1 hypothetical protein T281_14110 [Rhodomicrobium udaipurense JA643]
MTTMKHAHPFSHAAATSATETGGFFDKALGLLSSVKRRWSEETEIRQAVAELEQLDDRALRDIGLNRYDLEDSVRKHHEH